MIYETVCISVFSFTIYLTFFYFKKPVSILFEILDLDNTTSDILYEMKLYYNTRKIQRWWRSYFILNKRDILCGNNSIMQYKIDNISHQLNRNLFL